MLAGAAAAAAGPQGGAMGEHTTDESVLRHIRELVDEEHRLRNAAAPLDPPGTKRLEHLQVELDQCWDLLRQRRAKREFGDDPDQAEVRPENVVESYEQ
jgi:hypothetical protein